MTRPKEAWPTEDLATKAVDAAARSEYERVAEVGSMPWEDVPATIKLALRQHCLPIVWAALTNLPDPRYAAWEEGRAGGYSDASFESEGFGPTPPGLTYPHENPYPSGL